MAIATRELLQLTEASNRAARGPEGVPIPPILVQALDVGDEEFALNYMGRVLEKLGVTAFKKRVDDWADYANFMNESDLALKLRAIEQKLVSVSADPALARQTIESAMPRGVADGAN